MLAWLHKHMSTQTFWHIAKSSSAEGCTRHWLAILTIVLPRRRLLHPAADDDFVICQNARVELVLPSQCLVRPAADDDFGKLSATLFAQILSIIHENIFYNKF